ncbi:MAG TPA: DUF6516 family protein [Nitrospirota bacterium]|jgi:hypothetical protein
MFEIIGRLEESGLVREIEVVDLIEGEGIYYLKFKAAMKNGGLFYFTELQKLGYNSYSYHLQDKDGKLVARWDNSPHHKNLETYPHHRHTGGRIKPSFKPTVDELIKYLQDIAPRQ